MNWRAGSIAFLLACLMPLNAQAQRPRTPFKVVEHLEIEKSPLLFYLAKGGPDACGEGCDEWIAAEGQFDSGSVERFRAFLKRLDGRRLPIYFYSPGGLTDDGLAIGRLLRENDMTAGVAKTIPDGCEEKKPGACRALKRSGQTLAARWRTIDAGCNSACVYALIGAKTRDVPPGASVGIHASKVPYTGERARAAAVARLASFNLELRRYLREMGIDDGLFAAIQKVPYEKVHILSRDEITRFGIDTRRNQETRWTFIEGPRPRRAHVVKLFTRPKGPEHREIRTGLIRLRCGEADQLNVRYVRGLGSDELNPAGRGSTTSATIRLVAGSASLAFPTQSPISKLEAVDSEGATDGRGLSSSIDFFEAAAERPNLELVEAETSVEPTARRRVHTLSTRGLSEAIAALRRSCGRAS
jgi:hypothetical protein